MGAYPGVKVAAQVASAPVVINQLTSYSPYLSPFPNWTLGLIATVSSGASLTYSVQVTADPIPTANGNWNNHDILVSQVASANGNITYPVTGVRLNVTAYSSGSVNLGICQWP
jgi:hypothetical protein